MREKRETEGKGRREETTIENELNRIDRSDRNGMEILY